MYSSIYIFSANTIYFLMKFSQIVYYDMINNLWKLWSGCWIHTKIAAPTLIFCPHRCLKNTLKIEKKSVFLKTQIPKTVRDKAILSKKSAVQSKYDPSHERSCQILEWSGQRKKSSTIFVLALTLLRKKTFFHLFLNKIFPLRSCKIF